MQIILDISTNSLHYFVKCYMCWESRYCLFWAPFPKFPNSPLVASMSLITKNCAWKFGRVGRAAFVVTVEMHVRLTVLAACKNILLWYCLCAILQVHIPAVNFFFSKKFCVAPLQPSAKINYYQCPPTC